MIGLGKGGMKVWIDILRNKIEWGSVVIVCFLNFRLMILDVDIK